MVLSPLAAGRAVLSNEERELGTGLIDLGGGTTTVAVFRGGGVRHTAVIPVGGNHITNDIAAGLRTPVAAAETMKVTLGSADRSSVGRDEVVDVVPTASRPHHTVPRLALVDIIEARVQEILTLIHRELVKSNVDDLMPGGLVLTGGGALLSGIDTLAERLFGIPVRVGGPREVVGSTEGLLSPQGAVAVGLVQHALEFSGGARWYGGAVGSTGVLQRVGNWFAEMF
jgi:cell division protein FtsA